MNNNSTFSLDDYLFRLGMSVKRTAISIAVVLLGYLLLYAIYQAMIHYGGYSPFLPVDKTFFASGSIDGNIKLYWDTYPKGQSLYIVLFLIWCLYSVYRLSIAITGMFFMFFAVFFASVFAPFLKN